MPERSVGSANYRYAFNGMEQDNEISGNGNSYTTEFRQYDPRLGRWKSLDPLMMEFSDVSPYSAFNNNPVVFIDPLGLAAESSNKPKKGIVYGTKLGKKIKNWIRFNVKSLFNKEFRIKLRTVKNNHEKITIIQNEKDSRKLKDGGKIVKSEVDGVDLWKYGGGGSGGIIPDDTDDDLDTYDNDSNDDYVIKERVFRRKHSTYKKVRKLKKSTINRLRWGFSTSLETTSGNIHFFSFGFGNNYRTHNIVFFKHGEQRKFNHNSFYPLLGIKWKTRKGVVNFIYIGTAIRKKNGNDLSLVADLTRRRRRRRRRKKL